MVKFFRREDFHTRRYLYRFGSNLIGEMRCLDMFRAPHCCDEDSTCAAHTSKCSSYFGRLTSLFSFTFHICHLLISKFPLSNCQASLCFFCPFLFWKQQGEDGRDKVSNENHISDLKSEDVFWIEGEIRKKTEPKQVKSLTQAPLPYTKSMASKVGPA